jgi:hypothetical protein
VQVHIDNNFIIDNNYIINVNIQAPVSAPVEKYALSASSRPVNRFTLNPKATPFVPNFSVGTSSTGQLVSNTKTANAIEEMTTQLASLHLQQPGKTEKYSHNLSSFSLPSNDDRMSSEKNEHKKQTTLVSRDLWKKFDKSALPVLIVQSTTRTKKNDIPQNNSANRNLMVISDDERDSVLEKNVFDEILFVDSPLYSGPSSEAAQSLNTKILACTTIDDLLNIWKKAKRHQWDPSNYIRFLNRWAAIQSTSGSYEYILASAISHCIGFVQNLNTLYLALFVNAATRLLRRDARKNLIKTVDKLLSETRCRAIVECGYGVSKDDENPLKQLAVIAQAFGKADGCVENSHTLNAIECQLLYNDSSMPLFYNGGDGATWPHSLTREVAKLASGFGNANMSSKKLFQLLATLLLRNDGYLLRRAKDTTELSMIIQGFCTQEMDCRDLLKEISIIIFSNLDILKFDFVLFVTVVNAIVESSYINTHNRKDLYGCRDLITLLIKWLHGQTEHNIVISEWVLSVCKKLEFAYPDFTKKLIPVGTLLKKQMDEYEACMRNPQARPQHPFTSKSQDKVAAHLKETYSIEAYVVGGFVADFYDPLKKELIEFEGEHHYYNNRPRVPTIRAQFRTMVLEYHGYSVKSIPYWDWTSDFETQRECIIRHVGEHALAKKARRKA